jgi:hypothetical protein
MIKHLTVLAAFIAGSCLAYAQDVDVSAIKNGVSMTVEAQKTYHMMAGEDKIPTLAVHCVRKGNKGGHLIVFSPGGEMLLGGTGLNAASAPQSLSVTINGKTQATTWAPYGDVASFTYYGKTEPERVDFIHSVLDAGTVTIEFKPFLTGEKIKAVFDVTKLREEYNKHSECSQN